MHPRPPAAVHLPPPGTTVRITARHADGTAYRWWPAVVEAASPDLVVTLTRAGDPVGEPGRQRPSRFAIRSHYWPGRPHTLSELYEPDGSPRELYADIIAGLTITRGEIAYVDHELDVRKAPGRPPEVLDEDEFAAAIATYGYSPALQAACRAAVEQALALVDAWAWPGRV